jgi:ABC-2 type transport system permease protein
VIGDAFFALLVRDLVVTRRLIISLLLQDLIQPLFFLFIFGKILPGTGVIQQSFGALLLPGIIALTIMITSIQAVTFPLVLDLGYAREIDDRLLAPLPISLVALEKIVFATLRGLFSGAIIFPAAYWILGSAYQVRSDAIWLIVLIMILTAFASASLGLALGTQTQPEQMGLVFALILAPLIFTGCTYYPWAALNSVKWFQFITLLNPLTYAAEGLRNAMLPPLDSPTLPTLGLGWVMLGLGVTLVLFMIVSVYSFNRRGIQ